ncbi:hypothetical protein SAMN06265340_1143 [Desulfurobacterium atlanticum]|uniref:Type I restriction enzyme R protein N terminus (HSDR_N) n=2 Tax=Desulfurobacterium atlanticum TaxID=240169 RepID=A0A239A0D0_9BACT|nr:hypothetical protein SAMN06265340_1143 [Desulfurobacterium atlanticum]
MKEIFEQLELKLKNSIFNRASDIIKALLEFLHKEKFLLQNDINERALTHKLALYLQNYFHDYDVDCEYNRMMKNNEYIKKTLNLPADEGIIISDTTQKTVYPDIIIHRRGNNDNNLLVIEVKKSVNVNENERNFDFQKLKAFTEQLRYNLGLYLEFNENGISDFKLFENGEKVGEYDG